MKQRLIKGFCLLLLFVTVQQGFAQKQKAVAEAMPLFTADSLAGGNYKDILTSFFQLSFNNLTGDKREFNFNTNPFAVMLKNDPDLAIDRNYYKNRVLRKLNIGFGLKLDTSYRFNGFSSGIKYALINKRDSTTSKMLFSKLLTDSMGIERDTLALYLKKYADSLFPAATNAALPGHTDDLAKKKEFNASLNKLFNDSNAVLNKMDSTFRIAVLDIAGKKKLYILSKFFKTSPNMSLRRFHDKSFSELKQSLKSEPLWIIAVSDTTYKNQFAFSNLVFSTEFSKGVFKPQPGANNLELNIKAAANFLKDTLQQGNNLKRVLFNVEAGLNWVIRNKTNEKSYFELKLSSTYYRNFSSLYAKEKREMFTLNGTARVRVYEDIWVPLEIKYDPKNGNVFGCLNVKANFTGVGKLVKEMSK